MSKLAISDSEYYQLIGLITLARDYQKKLDDLVGAAASILEVEDEGGGYYGVLSDEMYDESSTAPRLLKKLGVKVLAEKRKGKSA
jgi:hypothetical protein